MAARKQAIVRSQRGSPAARSSDAPPSESLASGVRNLKIEYLPASSLKPNKNNPRTHSANQIRQIARSIRGFGWINPIIVDRSKSVIAGHGRLAAAKLEGIKNVPVICIEDMTPAEVQAYILADNKLAENAGWDLELLAIELHGFLEMDPSFDLTITGFDMGEIDRLLTAPSGEKGDAEKVPEIDQKNLPVARPGDLWCLGSHRLLCGDATKPANFNQLMGEASAEMAFTDPPYNVQIAGHVSGLGSRRHSEFVMASGEMSQTEYFAFLTTTLQLMADHSSAGALHFVFADWRHICDVLTAGNAIFSELKNLCVWVKTNGGMGSLYRSQHELIAIFKKGTARHSNNVQLGRHGRNRTNVWTYPGMNSFGADRDKALAMHPTVKPVALVEDAILDCSRRNGIVLDAFIGSGTTLIAAQRAGRRCFGLEMDPRYVDVTLRRFREFTGDEPIHEPSGQSLAELERADDRRPLR